MKKLFLKYSRIINTLPIYARSGILAGGLLLVFIIWNSGFWQPLKLQKIEQASKLQQIEREVKVFQDQLRTLNETAKAQQKKESAAEKAALLAAANLTAKTKEDNQFVSPQQAANVLRDLLAARHNVTVIQFQLIPTKYVQVPSSSIKAYEHSIIIKFRGDFAATASYLLAIEKLDWRIYWDMFDYKVVKYPNAEVTIQLHTLSDQEGWLNV